MNKNDELKNVLEQLADEEIQENSNIGYAKRKNADYLEKLAYVNLALFILGAVYIIINSFVNEISWIGIATGIASLIIGFTLFFLLETIVDIYRKMK